MRGVQCSVDAMSLSTVSLQGVLLFKHAFFQWSESEMAARQPTKKSPKVNVHFCAAINPGLILRLQLQSWNFFDEKINAATTIVYIIIKAVN